MDEASEDISSDSEPPIYYEHITEGVSFKKSVPETKDKFKLMEKSSEEDDSGNEVVICDTPPCSKVTIVVESSQSAAVSQHSVINDTIASQALLSSPLPDLAQEDVNASQPKIITILTSSSSDDLENQEDQFENDSVEEPMHSEPQTAPTKEAEERFRNKLKEAREKYLETVKAALEELHGKTVSPKDFKLREPPAFERMTDQEMENELAGFGFRFTTRESAISKLTRCWAAVNSKVPNISSKETPLSPIDFIRTKSKYYEQILIYQPIPLASLLREMNDAGVKISSNRLRTILDDEGVAFLDDNSAR